MPPRRMAPGGTFSRDPKLDELERAATGANQDLQQAVTRIEEGPPANAHRRRELLPHV